VSSNTLFCEYEKLVVKSESYISGQFEDLRIKIARQQNFFRAMLFGDAN
jgi:hypothetical protein